MKQNNNNEDAPVGFNPLRQNRPKLFNSKKIWTETISPITDEQKQNAAKLRENLIRKTRAEL